MSQKQIQIDENYIYCDIVPRPNPKERTCLKQSIITDGQQLPIIINPGGMILDGHTRYEICLELAIKPIYKVKKFDSEQDERKFVIMSNIARRQLTTFQKVELTWEIYENEKTKADKRMNWRQYVKTGRLEKGQFLKPKQMPDNFQKQGNAILIFARYIGLGKTLVHKVEWLKRNADAGLLKEVRDGRISITKAYDYERGLQLQSGNLMQRTKKKRRKKMKYNKEIPLYCPECNVDTILVKKKPCHVHKKVCCTTCKWGY